MKLLLYIAAIIVIILISCKKEKDESKSQLHYLSSQAMAGWNGMESVLLPDGNILLVARSSSKNVALAKVSADGSLIWNNTITISDCESIYITGIVTDNYGFIYVSGSTKQINSDYDLLLLKYSPEGNLLWKKSHVGNFGNDVNEIFLTTDGNLLLGGTKKTSNHFLLYIMKADTSGNISSQKIYDGDLLNQKLGRLVKTNDSGYLLASTTSYSPYCIKTDADGIIQWSRTYSDIDSVLIKQAIQTDDNGFLLVGSTTNSFKLFAVKLSSTGDVLWSKSFASLSYELTATSVIQKEDNSYIISVQKMKDGGSDAALFGLSSLGDSLWLKNIGVISFSWPSAIYKININQNLVVGPVTSNSIPSASVFITYVDDEGNIIR